MERLLKALGDATRLRIVGLLLTGEVCVCHIHESLRLPQPKISRHLAYLRRAGLVDTRRDGVWIYYRLATTADPILRTIREAVVHALGHVESIRRDAERLRQKTGCCVPAAGQLSLACCEAQAADLLGGGPARKGNQRPPPADGEGSSASRRRLVHDLLRRGE
jgi:ArsR family transcriptional regulator, arsenate/arsenite/antimonite-responsive transcriptional repressor